MQQIFGNNGTSTLSAGIAPADTSIFIAPGQGGRFPVVTAPDFAYCTLEDASGNIEIVKVTTHTAASTSFTVVRAQQGTTARSYGIGDLFELRGTAGEATTWEADIDALEASRALKAGDVYGAGTHDFTAGTTRVKTATPGVSSTEAANMSALLAAIAAVNAVTGLVRMNADAATQVVSIGEEYEAHYAGVVEFTMPTTTTDGALVGFVTSNGYDNVVKFGAQTLLGPLGELTGDVSLGLGNLYCRWNQNKSKWVVQ